MGSPVKVQWRAVLLGVALSTAAAPSWAGEEEIDLDALDEPGEAPPKQMVTRVPEHDYDRRLIVFPLLLVAILAWNVKWKQDPVPAKKPASPAANKEGSP